MSKYDVGDVVEWWEPAEPDNLLQEHEAPVQGVVVEVISEVAYVRWGDGVIPYACSDSCMRLVNHGSSD